MDSLTPAVLTPADTTQALLFAALAAVGAACAWALAQDVVASVQAQVRIARDGVPVRARVVDVHRERLAREREVRYHPVVAYTAPGGREHTRARTREHLSHPLGVNRPITVRVRPWAPDEVDVFRPVKTAARAVLALPVLAAAGTACAVQALLLVLAALPV